MAKILLKKTAELGLRILQDQDSNTRIRTIKEINTRTKKQEFKNPLTRHKRIETIDKFRQRIIIQQDKKLDKRSSTLRRSKGRAPI